MLTNRIVLALFLPSVPLSALAANGSADVRYRFSKNIDFALNLKNLFDRKYFETSTFGTWENGISPGAPFTAFGTIRFRY